MSRSDTGPGCFHYVENVLVMIGVVLLLLGVFLIVITVLGVK